MEEEEEEEEYDFEYSDDDQNQEIEEADVALENAYYAAKGEKTQGDLEAALAGRWVGGWFGWIEEDETV